MGDHRLHAAMVLRHCAQDVGEVGKAGELAVDDLELVGAGVVDAQVGGEPVGDLAEPARDDGEAVAEPAQGPHHRACARSELDGVVDLVERGGGHTLQQGDALP